MRFRLFFATLVAMLLCIANTARAGLETADFDFESQPTTMQGGLTSLSLTDNGFTIAIDRSGQPFDMADISSMGGTESLGSRTLAPTPPGMNAFTVDFSEPVDSFSVQLGDFGADFSDSLSLTGFTGHDGTGSVVASVIDLLPLSNASLLTSKVLTLNQPKMLSVEFLGGTLGQANSVFADNILVLFSRPDDGGHEGAMHAVPLPPAVYGAALALILMWVARKQFEMYAMK